MTIYDDIRASANGILDMANQAEQQIQTQGDPLVWPVGIDCLAGTRPTDTYMQPFEQDMNYFAMKTQYSLKRLHDNTPNGSVLFYGDSIFEGMNISEVTPFGANHAISGNTFRGVLTQLIDAPSIHHASAVVLLVGICDLVQDERPLMDIPYFFTNKLFNWMTGKWIVCHILPINETLYAPIARDIYHEIVGPVRNSHIDQMNTRIDEIFANRSDVKIVDVKSQLAPQGQLLTAYSGDGIHLNGAGYTTLKNGIREKLT